MVRHQAEKVGSFILELAYQTNTGSPTCTIMTMCTIMDREGPYSFIRVRQMKFKKLSDFHLSVDLKHVPKIHFLFSSNGNNQIRILPRIHPFILPLTLSQYEYGPMSSGCTCLVSGSSFTKRPSKPPLV